MKAKRYGKIVNFCSLTLNGRWGGYVPYVAPNGASDFVCFEPVSHPVGAFNLPGGPHHYGLKTLRDGESLRAWSRYGPSQLQAMRA